jgi:hypothetical protein
MLMVALSVFTSSLPANAEEDLRALYWDCMALSTIMVGQSLGIPKTQKNADDAMMAAATKFGEEANTTPGLARGRMRRAWNYYGGPSGVTNECAERGWLFTHAN